LLGHVDVADPRLRGGQVLRGDVDVGDGVLETVLRRTEAGAGGRDGGQGRVEGLDGGLGTGSRGDVQGGATGAAGVVHARLDDGLQVVGRQVDGDGVAVTGALGTHLDVQVRGGGRQQADPVEVRRVDDAVELVGELAELRGDRRAGVGVVGVVGRLHRQVAHALQD